MIDADREDAEFAAFATRLQARLAARVMAWFLAPGAIAAVAVWIVYTSVVCWGGRPLVIELYLCKYSGLLPIFSFVFLSAGTVWLLFAMTREGVKVPAFAMAGVDGSERASRVDPTLLQRLIRFAVKMGCWAYATLIAAWIFYYWEYSFPFGIITIAACFRLLLIPGLWILERRRKRDRETA